MSKLANDCKAERISRADRESRKSHLKKGSLVY